jgi:hypothetical protein
VPTFVTDYQLIVLVLHSLAQTGGAGDFRVDPQMLPFISAQQVQPGLSLSFHFNLIPNVFKLLSVRRSR